MYAIYARQSVDRMDSTSIDDQIEYCKAQIKHHISKTGGTGLLNRLEKSAYREYRDKGYSGKDVNRPAFGRLIKDIESGEIKTVVVYKLDRISRSVLDFSNMWEKFTKHNVEFISCHESFDTTSPNGRAMIQICIVFAQLERETIQQRVTDTYYARSRQGFYMGGRVPYGFKLENININGKKTSRYVVSSDESEHIKLMYAMYSEPGVSLGDIVRYMRDNNISNMRRVSLNTNRISESLRNPVYVKADIDIYNFFKDNGTNIINDVSDFTGENGCYLYNAKGGKSNKKQYELMGKELVLAPHLGIISSDIWLKCRVKCMNNRQSTTTCKGKNTWLSGKLKCGRCGYSLAIRKSNTKAGRYFICSSISSSRKCGGAGTLYADEIEEALLSEIKNKLKDILPLVHKEKKVNPQIYQKKVRLAEIDKEIDNWVNQAEHAGGPLLRIINEKVGKLDEERKALRDELFILTDSPCDNKAEQINDIDEIWEKVVFEDRKLIVDMLIKVIYIANGAIEIAWKF